jgi:hypothetical protein
MEALNGFISPLALTENPEELDELMGSDWEGWPFGRDLYVAEVFSLLQRVPGVKHVLDVQLSQRPVTPDHELSPDAIEPQESEETLNPVEQKVVRVPADSLLCSLAHEITLVDLGENHE